MTSSVSLLEGSVDHPMDRPVPTQRPGGPSVGRFIAWEEPKSTVNWSPLWYEDCLDSIHAAADEVRGYVIQPDASGSEPASTGLDVEEIRRWRETTHTANEVMSALYPLLQTARVFRDADGRKMRAIAQAERDLLDALGDFEEVAARLAPTAPRCGQ